MSLPSLQPRSGWGMSNRTVAHVVPVLSQDDVLAAFDLARANGMRVGSWGNGRSYGDAALNDSEVLLDFRGMNRILSWDPKTGVVRAQPGVTLAELWRSCLGDGWWPPVVSGTMHTTLGGCVAANVHGKNNHHHGPIGDHVLGFTLVTPAGEVHEVTPESHPDLFHAAIGGFGWLGCFTEIRLQMKRVHSGRLEVTAFTEPDLDRMFDGFERSLAGGSDYVVGWIDGFASGAALGRGQIHAARYLAAGEDPEGLAMMTPEAQDLPSTFFGVVPKRWLWRFMKPFANRWGTRLVNLVRYTWASLGRTQHTELQTHARFNFLLDYVPDWKRIYEPGGLIQYQFFLPRDRARDVIRRALQLARNERLEPWLVVMKRHRPDRFWLSHALDGYSFACDFPVTERNRGRLYQLCRSFDAMVVEAGGRFYFAKDSVTSGAAVRASLGDTVLQRFFALKQRHDPDALLSSNLFRRVFSPVVPALPLYPDFEHVLHDTPAPTLVAPAEGEE